MLIDEVEVTFQAGKGGPGKISFYPGQKSGPDGGNGGKGGDIYIRAVNDLNLLNQFSAKKLISAEDGKPGERNRKFGKDGQDLEIILPVGVTLIDKQTSESIELNKEGERVLLCKGGKGGKGNFEFKSSTNTTPKYAQPGLLGQEKHFKISLKLIADFGLIGLPNAGKSSLLNELTNAKARVAAYPFTTLEPNLGVFDNPSASSGQGKIIADIPGLIEGASLGKGLGIKFLKHIEKVSLLLHCIASDSVDPVRDYKTVLNELKKFNPNLLTKPQIILLTKTDLIKMAEIDKKIKLLSKLKFKILPVSIYDYSAITHLRSALAI